MKIITKLSLLITLFTSLTLQAAVNLPAIISDHMVLQANETVKIWGWGKALEPVNVSCSWDTNTYHTVVDNQANWSINITTPAAGGPYEITVKGYNEIKIQDVLIGEVWLGSGQSNMEMSASWGIDDSLKHIQESDYPDIRLFTVVTNTARSHQKDTKGEWVKCSPETMPYFSAVLYFFGREIHQKLNVPVGLINSSWGGTPIEVWVDEAIWNNDIYLSKNALKLEDMTWAPKEPGRTYNIMIHPIIPFKIKGALWYQGETNTGNANHYARSLKTLIDSWRAAWGYEFPFYYAQIAPWKGYGDFPSGAIVRDQQRRVLDMVDNTGMVVVSDIGDLDDIHPKNKLDAGLRFAYWALEKDYDIDTPYSGPLYKKHKEDKGKLIVEFKHEKEGLVAKDGELTEFEIAGADGIWYAAEAKIIDTDKIEVSNKKVKKPVNVRFGFSNSSNPNLFNSAGLPASCFITEE